MRSSSLLSYFLWISHLASSYAKSGTRVSSVLRLGEVAYFVKSGPPFGKSIGSGSSFEPCSVIDVSSSQITLDFLDQTLSRFALSDDVWTLDFLNCVIFQSISDEARVTDEVKLYLEGRGTTQIHTIHPDIPSDRCPEGPYFLNAGSLLYAYRLYPDVNGAFVVATVEGDEPYSHVSLDASAYGEVYPSALTVAVPSRLRFRPTKDTPLAGIRIAVKDTMDLRGMKTGASSRAYTALYHPREENAVVIQTLLELGAIIVGKTKTTQFADSEWATCDWIDYHAPFNPRGDGYLSPSGSSSGSAAAIASYDWLDLSLGTDTMGSTRAPAAAQGIYGMRPSLGAGSVKGIIPYSSLFDTPGAFARDATSLATLAKAIYGSGAKPRCIRSPSKLLYPTDYWPTTHAPSQALFDPFIKKLELFLGIERTELNLQQLWTTTNPEGTKESLSDFLEHAFEWAAHREQWTGFFKDFLQDYEDTIQKAAILNPQLRFKRDWLPTITRDQQIEGIRRLHVYKTWFYQQIMPPSKDGCLDTLIVLPWTNGQPEFRDKYRDGPQEFTGLGFFWYVIAPYAEAPEVVIPVGTTPYTSPLSMSEEQLPAAISIVSAKGTDVALTEFIAQLMGNSENDVGLSYWNEGQTAQDVVKHGELKL